MAAKCAAITRKGSPCPSPPLPDSAWCWVHSSDLAEARRDASRKGGVARGNRERARKALPPALTPEELQSLVSLTIERVIAGQTEPAIGNCVASLARALVVVQEATTVEARLRELEQAAEQDAPRRWRA